MTMCQGAIRAMVKGYGYLSRGQGGGQVVMEVGGVSRAYLDQDTDTWSPRGLQEVGNRI